MSTNTKQALEQINKVSRQLLSHILTVHNQTIENTLITSESNNDELNDNELNTEDELTKLLSKRDGLINCLFTQNTNEEIESELTLLNEMISLDSELSNKSQLCKQILAEKIIKLKKGTKASKSYQKY